MPLTGTLRDVSLFNLIQLQCSERQRVRVSLTHDQRVGTLICANGELIFASAGHMTGEDAVHELLTWEYAEFRVDCHPAPVDRNIAVPWTALLLDGVRRADEARAKHDDRLEASLRSMQGTHGLRAALMVDGDGQLRAAATEAAPATEAALVAFLAGRMEAIGAILSGGQFREALFPGPTEALWMVRQHDAYLACWVEGRASLASLKALLPLLLLTEQVEGAPRVVGGSSLSH